ncbi:MAG: CDP-alcohol phosphatidyltransferase family protein, partial [Proteobacteria bacterium]|nr:CDP-alcohol phosphatidyltransferase family protein [Pseudomonadota bacterium]
MPLNIPNLLTWFRILLIPVFLGVFYLPDATLSLHHKHLVSTVIFTLAALTDWLDGYLARALNQTSAFGAFL